MLEDLIMPSDSGAVLAVGWRALALHGIPPGADGDARDFFSGALRAEAELRETPRAEFAAKIQEHIVYLADKRGLPTLSLLAETSQPDDLVARDAIWNIASVLGAALEVDTAADQDSLRMQEELDLVSESDAADVPFSVLKAIQAAERALPGWCSREKALAMARLVLAERPQICVEIGVYGGRSLIPCAAALVANGMGSIYGVECWNATEAIRNATNIENDAWWENVDFAQVKAAFYRFVADHDLTRQVCMVEASSRHAAAMFDTIDFLHVDGSHAVIGAAEDVLLFAPKVRSGGIIIFDDTDWDTTEAAQILLAAFARPLMTPRQVQEAHYAIFRRY